MKNVNIEETRKRAVAYVRVSTKEQVDEGNSLATQKRICNEYIVKHGYIPAEVFVEEGESAKTADRTELQKMLSYCADKKNGISAVIIYKIDRLARNSDDYSQLRLVLKKYGVEIKSTSEQFENNPVGRFMENTMANIAQLDNDIRSERCRNGMLDAVRQGRYVWGAPVGYKNDKIDGESNIIPDEMSSLVVSTFEMVATALYPTDEVRKKMITQGLRLKSGKAPTKGYFYKLLQNETYCGFINKFGERHKGIFVAIVSIELFQQVQRVLKNKGRKISQYKSDNPDFPLRRFIQSTTGKSLTGSWSRGNGGKYAFYRFEKEKQNYKKQVFETWFKNFMDGYAMSDTHIQKLKLAIKKNWTMKIEGSKLETKRLRTFVTISKERQSLLIQKNMKGIISDSLLQEELARIDEKVTEAEITLIDMKENNINVEEALSFAEAFLKNPSMIWEKAKKAETKLKLQWFQFPEGLVFDGKKFGTTKISSIFKLKEAFQPLQSTVVDPSIEFWNQFVKEAEYLKMILKEDKGR